MKKGRFLWSAHRITEKQKAGKARNIKGKQLKNSRNTVSKQLVAHLSSQRDNKKVYTNLRKALETQCFRGFLHVYIFTYFRKKWLIFYGSTHVAHT